MTMIYGPSGAELLLVLKAQGAAQAAADMAKVRSSVVDLNRISQQLGYTNNMLNLINSKMTGSLGAVTSAHEKAIPIIEKHKKVTQAHSTAVRQSGMTLFYMASALSAATGAMGMVIGKSIQVAAEFEQIQIGLTSLLRSTQAADEMIEKMWRFAISSPFEMKGLLEANRQLLAFGFAAQDVIPMLSLISDALSASGKLGPEALNNITLALGQVLMKGKLTGEELTRQLGQYIPAARFLYESMGISSAELLDKMKEGAIDAATAITGILKGIQREYGGASAAQMTTLLGMWSNLKDALTRLWEALGKQMIKALDLGPKVQEVVNALVIFGSLVKSEGIAAAFRDMFPEEIRNKIIAIAGAITGGLVAALITLGTTVIAAVPGLLPLAIAGAVLATAWEQNWGDIQEKVQKFRDWFEPIVKNEIIPFIQHIWLETSILLIEWKDNWNKIQTYLKDKSTPIRQDLKDTADMIELLGNVCRWAASAIVFLAKNMAALPRPQGISEWLDFLQNPGGFMGAKVGAAAMDKLGEATGKWIDQQVAANAALDPGSLEAYIAWMRSTQKVQEERNKALAAGNQLLVDQVEDLGINIAKENTLANAEKEYAKSVWDRVAALQANYLKQQELAKAEKERSMDWEEYEARLRALQGAMSDAMEKTVKSAKALGFSVSDLVNALVALNPATIAAAAAVEMWKGRIDDVNLAIEANRDQQKAAQADMDRMTEHLAKLNEELSTLKQKLTDLSTTPLTGMGEMDEKIAAAQRQLQRLNLAEQLGIPLEEVVKMFPMLKEGMEKYAGTLPTTVAGLDAFIKALQLVKSLKFDEKLADIAKTAGDVKKEMDYEDIIKGIIPLKDRIKDLTGEISIQEKAIIAQKDVMKQLKDEADRLNDTLREYQRQLKLAEQSMKDVIEALKLFYNWLFDDKKKITELGNEATLQGDIVDDAMRTLMAGLQSFAQGVNTDVGKLLDDAKLKVNELTAAIAKLRAELAGEGGGALPSGVLGARPSMLDFGGGPPGYTPGILPRPGTGYGIGAGGLPRPPAAWSPFPTWFNIGLGGGAFKDEIARILDDYAYAVKLAGDTYQAGAIQAQALFATEGSTAAAKEKRDATLVRLENDRNAALRAYHDALMAEVARIQAEYYFITKPKPPLPTLMTQIEQNFEKYAGPAMEITGAIGTLLREAQTELETATGARRSQLTDLIAQYQRTIEKFRINEFAVGGGGGGLTTREEEMLGLKQREAGAALSQLGSQYPELFRPRGAKKLMRVGNQWLYTTDPFLLTGRPASSARIPTTKAIWPEPPGSGEGFASGGIVPGPLGAARLVVAHGGETITPAGATTTININNPTVRSDEDIRRLAYEVSRIIGRGASGRIVSG